MGSADRPTAHKATPRAWRALVKQLLADAERARERRTAAQLTLRAAELHAAYDADGQARAGELLDKALGLWPGMADGLDFLERWLGEKEDWTALADSLGRIAAATRDRAALASSRRRASIALTVLPSSFPSTRLPANPSKNPSACPLKFLPSRTTTTSTSVVPFGCDVKV